MQCHLSSEPENGHELFLLISKAKILMEAPRFEAAEKQTGRAGCCCYRERVQPRGDGFCSLLLHYWPSHVLLCPAADCQSRPAQLTVLGDCNVCGEGLQATPKGCTAAPPKVLLYAAEISNSQDIWGERK